MNAQRRLATIETNLRRTRPVAIDGQVSTTLPEGFRIRSAADVLALLDDQADALLSDPTLSTMERAKAITAVSIVALKAAYDANEADRLEAVERVLKAQKERAKEMARAERKRLG